MTTTATNDRNLNLVQDLVFDAIVALNTSNTSRYEASRDASLALAEAYGISFETVSAMIDEAKELYQQGEDLEFEMADIALEEHQAAEWASYLQAEEDEYNRQQNVCPCCVDFEKYMNQPAD